MYSVLKRIFIGTPIASADEHRHRLIKLVALAVFASDAISSTAYATEEILVVLVPAGGLESIEALIPIAVVVLILLAIVVTSYRQTIYAYPQGGGSYVVSRENLGTMPSLVAGSSLLVDYVLTVAVSVSAGVAAITSAFTDLAPYRVELCLIAIVIMTVANLRGLKESGRIFAGPTYIYVLSVLGLIAYGCSAPTPATCRRCHLTRPTSRRSSAARPVRPSGCSCCCGPSRRVPWPCRASRRSPTACPPSGHPSPATPPAPLWRWPPSWARCSSGWHCSPIASGSSRPSCPPWARRCGATGRRSTTSSSSRRSPS